MVQLIQVASGASFCVFPFGTPDSGLCSGLVPLSEISDHLVISCLSDCLAILECSLELLADHVSGILVRLDFLSAVPLVSSSLAPFFVIFVALSSEVDTDIIVNNALSSSDVTSSITIDAVVDLSTSSSRVLTAKMGGLEMKLVALEASVGSVLDKLNILCSDLGLSAPTDMNNCAKQADIVCWHKDMNNMVSIVTETKLKGKICPWITDKFDGVHVFTSELDSGHMGSGVAIILDSSLVRHVCKVSEVPGRLLLVRLLFKNKLSVSILELYTGAFLAVQFSQAGGVNSLIAKAVNESSFVILGGDFNEDGSRKCASFKKCFDLGLVNSLDGSLFVKSPTWCNSHGITKTINYVFIFSNLINVVVDCSMAGVDDFFDTDHKAVFVSVGIGGLLDVQLSLLHKQTNKDCWKFDIKNANGAKWLEFRDTSATNASMFLDAFGAAIMIFSADGTFKKKWFKGFDGIFTRVFSRFHKLELLVSKLVKASCLASSNEFVALLEVWYRLDSPNASVVRSLFLSGSGFDLICSVLAKAKKLYCASKLLKSKCAEESSIKQTISRRMESFELDKGHTIRSVLEHSFCKVVLDHLAMEDELILEPDSVKSKVDKIMKEWTRKCKVISDISEDWAHQYWPLEYVFDGAFFGVMCPISFDEMSAVVKDLPDGKVAGLSGISNKLWKCYDKSVLDMLLVLLNLCVVSELVPGP
ncbi:hypothetical protein G9A89_002708 [Geosiphon pyriformis]|nr:hypothetical protein G9A89_002708 [Geosiphon pyriformis]